MRNKVMNLLLEIGVPASCKGFNYIIDAIELMGTNDDFRYKTIDLYQCLAKKHNIQSARIERNIRYAFDRINTEAFNQYFGVNQKRANANLLSIIHLKIKEEC